MCAGIHLHLHLRGIYADAYSHRDANSDSNCNAIVHSHSHTYLDGKTNADPADCSNAEAASHPATAPIAYSYENKKH